MKMLIAAIVGGFVLAGTAAPCHAQGERAGAPPDPAQDRAAMRQRLERRLGEMGRIRDRLEAAIKRLDSGAPVESVRGELFPQGERRPGGDRGRDGPDRGRDGAGREPPGGPPMHGPPDPEADRRMVLRFLDEHDAGGAQRMREVLRDRPEDGERWVARSAGRIRTILEERDEGLRALRIREFKVGRNAVDAARRLGDALAAQPPVTGATESARADLEKALGEQFDVRLELHQREITVLEERIRTLKADLAEQQGRREGFVKERGEQILRATREWSQRGAKRPPAPDNPQR